MSLRLPLKNVLYKRSGLKLYSTANISPHEKYGRQEDLKVINRELILNENRSPIPAQSFYQSIQAFLERGQHRRGAVEFIYYMLERMRSLGVHRDPKAYKALISVFPTGVMVPTNSYQIEFFHYPKQQHCAITLMDQMNHLKIMPDEEMYEILRERFGEWTHTLRKFRRMMYWFNKYKWVDPYLGLKNLSYLEDEIFKAFTADLTACNEDQRGFMAAANNSPNQSGTNNENHGDKSRFSRDSKQKDYADRLKDIMTLSHVQFALCRMHDEVDRQVKIYTCYYHAGNIPNVIRNSNNPVYKTEKNMHISNIETTEQMNGNEPIFSTTPCLNQFSTFSIARLCCDTSTTKQIRQRITQLQKYQNSNLIDDSYMVQKPKDFYSPQVAASALMIKQMRKSSSTFLPEFYAQPLNCNDIDNVGTNDNFLNHHSNNNKNDEQNPNFRETGNDSKNRHWLFVTSQSPDQKKLLADLAVKSGKQEKDGASCENVTLSVEGPHIIWVNAKPIKHFILKAQLNESERKGIEEKMCLTARNFDDSREMLPYFNTLDTPQTAFPCMESNGMAYIQTPDMSKILAVVCFRSDLDSAFGYEGNNENKTTLDNNNNNDWKNNHTNDFGKTYKDKKEIDVTDEKLSMDNRGNYITEFGTRFFQNYEFSHDPDTLPLFLRNPSSKDHPKELSKQQLIATGEDQSKLTLPASKNALNLPSKNEDNNNSHLPSTSFMNKDDLIKEQENEKLQMRMGKSYLDRYPFYKWDIILFGPKKASQITTFGENKDTFQHLYDEPVKIPNFLVHENEALRKAYNSKKQKELLLWLKWLEVELGNSALSKLPVTFNFLPDATNIETFHTDTEFMNSKTRDYTRPLNFEDLQHPVYRF